MPRLSRVHIPGAYYLVEQRAPGLFGSFEDYGVFAELLEQRARHDRVSVLGFCFLPDCFVVLFQPATTTPVGVSVNYLEAAYARVSRERRGSHPRFARRPRVLLFDPHAYLVTLLRYLHWLPVHCGLCHDLGGHPWTSHDAYTGKHTFPWVSTRPALRLLGGGLNGYRRYRRCMSRPLDDVEVARAEGPGEVDPRVFGDRAFLASLPVRTHYRSTQRFEDVARSVALVLGVEVTEIGSARRAHRLSLARSMTTWQCVHRHIATVTECAVRLGGRNPRTLLRAVARYRSMYPKYFTLEGVPDAAPILPGLATSSSGGAH